MELKVFAHTLFTDDLPGVRDFYPKVFGCLPIHSDEVSVVYNFGGLLINILDINDARELVAPASAQLPLSGPAGMMTIQVQNVDAEAQRLNGLGVKLNNGPIDQPWGIRAITFLDPTGTLWEFSQPLFQSE